MFICHLRRRSNFLIVATLIPGLFLAYSCQTSSKKKSDIEQATLSTEAFKAPESHFTLRRPELKADYLLKHFWDNFNFRDTSIIIKPETSEKTFACFINAIRRLPSRESDKDIHSLMGKAETSGMMYQYFLELSEKYLYDPNSAVRDEVLYESFLKAALGSSVLDDAHKSRLQYQYEWVQKNKQGHKATNFKYTYRNGSSSRLYSIKANLLLIYFYDPECTDCKILREKIMGSVPIQDFLARDKLTILAVYPNEDLTAWRKHYKDLPSRWTNTYDKGSVIKKKGLYELHIPMLYLLDKNKNVLLKDARLKEVEGYILKN